MTEPLKTAELWQELRVLAVTISHYERQSRHTEADLARQDYNGVLTQLAQLLHLDPTQVHHPLLAGQGRSSDHAASVD